MAVLFVDIDLQHVRDLTSPSFKVVYAFFGLFLLFVFIRLAAFNRPLFFELLKVLRSSRVLMILSLCVLIAMGITYGMYMYTLNLMKEKEGQRLMAIAATAAAEIDARDLEPLRFARDMERPEYQRIYNKINTMRDRNDGVRWAYILRPTEDPEIFEFVADADTNYTLPLSDYDYNKDGVINDADDPAFPGMRYDATGQRLTRAWKQPFFEVTQDQWGIFISGLSPIYDASGNPVAILGVDMDISEFYKQTRNKFVPYWWFGGVFFLLIIFMLVLRYFPHMQVRGQG